MREEFRVSVRETTVSRILRALGLSQAPQGARRCGQRAWREVSAADRRARRPPRKRAGKTKPKTNVPATFRYLANSVPMLRRISIVFARYCEPERWGPDGRTLEEPARVAVSGRSMFVRNPASERSSEMTCRSARLANPRSAPRRPCCRQRACRDLDRDSSEARP